MPRPLIGITCSVDDKDLKVRRAYVDAVIRCGGLPVLLPVPSPEFGDAEVDAIARGHVAAVRGFLFTGGDDPRTERYGVPTHPMARPVAPERQRFEEALLRALDERPDTPTLGVCLGMQMMALHAGGTLNQHLPEDTPTHAEHTGDHRHLVLPAREQAGTQASAGGGPAPASAALRIPPSGCAVASWHHQAVRTLGQAGSNTVAGAGAARPVLRVVARSHDGVIEAVEDPARRFYLGVQWHPERSDRDSPGGDAVIRAFVEAARA